MIVADILMWFLLVAGTYIVINAYWLTTQGLFPDFVYRCRERIRRAPLKSFFIGLAGTVPGLILGVSMLVRAPNPALKFLGAAVLMLVILTGLMGSAGVAALVGTGLGGADDERTGWRRTWRGGLVLGLTFILPLIGWLLILPGTLIMGIGALASSFRRTRATPPRPVFEPDLAATR
jgi:hypothetical protein